LAAAYHPSQSWEREKHSEGVRVRGCVDNKLELAGIDNGLHNDPSSLRLFH
jgi:hypothetical protein